MASSIFGPSGSNFLFEPRELTSVLPRQESFIRRRENFFSWCYVDFANDVFIMECSDNLRPCEHSVADAGLDRVRHLAIQLWDRTPFVEFPWRSSRRISGYEEAVTFMRFRNICYFFRGLGNLALVFDVDGRGNNVALEKVGEESFLEERDLIRGHEKEIRGFKKEVKIPEVQFVKVVKS